MWKRLAADPSAPHDHVGSFDYPHRLELLEIEDSVTL